MIKPQVRVLPGALNPPPHSSRLDTLIETALTAAALVVGLVLLWTRRQRYEFNSFQATLLSILEIVGVFVSMVALGWLGVVILVGINIVAGLIWSAILAVRKEAILVDASVQSADMSVEEAGEIWDWMRKKKAFAVIRPLQRGDLIRALAEQARSPQEIRPMAVAVAQLSVIFDHDVLWLAPRFDQLLRLYDKSASDSEEVADLLVTSTKRSAASFEDMLIAMIVAAGGSVNEPDRGSQQKVVVKTRAA
jgi:hypothetical protein